MKDTKAFYLTMIGIIMGITSIAIGLYEHTGETSDDVSVSVLIMLVSFIMILIFVGLLYSDKPQITDIRPGLGFKIIYKVVHKDEYFYVLQVDDQLHFVQGLMDLGQEGKNYVMGVSKGELKTFPVSM